MTAEYTKPVRRITNTEDLEIWNGSQAYSTILDFVQDLQDLVVGLTNDAQVTVSSSSEELLKVLDKVNEIIENNPVVHEKDISRFGKIEFRDFYDEICKKSFDILKPLVEKLEDDPRIELATYFNESWGNRTRIDYGSGHELNFIAFLACLQKLGIIKHEDYPCVIVRVFTKYMTVMRALQKLYWLEPAGSHGVWGLDDYHFLPFLFGSSQLATHPHMKPKLIHNEELVESFYKQYMYLECIHFINTIKTTPANQDQKLSLRWHSPMLDDILSAKSWAKIKEGMIKMYKAEVLGKLPIVQHFMFGSIIPCPDGVSEYHEHDDDSDCGHDHGGTVNTWGDCCGIKIPSAIAASEMNKINNPNNKPIPFD
jgi:serine/threonine-protein phosphatase 2A activator